MKKFCIFCGKEPENKNKEHVLPQWLLSLTGDPNRRVNHGINPQTGQPVAFSWSHFTAPACTACNAKYSFLESEAKIIIQKLEEEIELTGNEALVLFNWLDKVRVGLWLNYYYLHGNMGGINPKFAINDRIGKKDRVLQIHFMKSATVQKGLNAFGTDTLVFQFMPSFFALRINKILILNGSTDFLVSRNCGFPHPKIITGVGMNGEFLAKEFIYNRETDINILNSNFQKGVLTLMQPIHNAYSFDLNYFSDGYLIQNCLDNKNRIGNLFRIESNTIKGIYNMNDLLPYESVTGTESKRMSQILENVYNCQNILLSAYEAPEFHNKYEIARKINDQYIEYYRDQ